MDLLQRPIKHGSHSKGKLSRLILIKVLRGYATHWNASCDLAFPCTCDVINFVSSGRRILVEVSAMTCTQAVDVLRKANVLIAPTKAACTGWGCCIWLEIQCIAWKADNIGDFGSHCYV
ncbi:hypothetical protein C5167_026868 [Papaver somniferum]|nr:hypothetical protein C5167_026868 [Papaver somniferum]